MNPFSLTKLPSDYLEILPQRLKVLRKKAGYSQQELATRSKVSLGSLKRFESSGQISLNALLRLMHVLGRLEDLENVLYYYEEMDKVKKRFDV
jgi:transcriptional regulator with XRE-family HTH domain